MTDQEASPSAAATDKDDDVANTPSVVPNNTVANPAPTFAAECPHPNEPTSADAAPPLPPRRRVTIEEHQPPTSVAEGIPSSGDAAEIADGETRRPSTSNGTTALSAALVGRFMALLSALSRVLRMIKAVRRPVVAVAQRAARLRVVHATRQYWRTLLRWLIALVSMLARRSRHVMRRGVSIAWRR